MAAAAEEHPGAMRRRLVLDRDQAASIREPGVEATAVYDWLLSEEARRG